MSTPKIKLNPDFSEGVDRKLLKVVKERFMRVNGERLSLCNAALSVKHRDIVALLPLLYHVNHPLLPGFVAKDTPFGVSGFEPDKSCISIAKSYSQSFKFKSSSVNPSAVHAIFMMGSTGTLAHSESSDVDLWLCYDATLDEKALASLKQKAEKIDQWANNLGLEVHTFLMDAKKFKGGFASGPVDKESSGSAQHYLLLDEFYRTAILLAGRYPIWWLVPPEQEKNYEKIVDLFLSKRFIKESDILDFGTAADIPKSELIGAGLWQLYKGLDSPYKSVLKILLAEVYAQELPQAQSLSQVFKQAVYDDEHSVESLDPYLLVYKRLESYLQARREHKRLDIVQKSFYLKVAKKLSRKPTSVNGASWQRVLLEKLVRQWGWSEDKVRYLDARASWRVDEVLLERQAIVSELSFSYRFLSQYARAHRIRSSITSEDLNILGRKLYAIFQKKAGKIERVNPGIVNSLWEENLSLHHSSTQLLSGDSEAWYAYRDLSTDTDAAFEVPLKKSMHLIEMLAWLYFNEILNSATRLSMSAGTSDVAINDVKGVIRSLESVVPLPMPPVPQSVYQQPASARQVILFINLGIDPLASLSESGLHILSDRTDPLDFSSERINLVQTIDQVCINSWREVTAHRFDAGETLLQCLQAFFQMRLEQPGEQPCDLQVFCFCPHRASAIAERVKALFAFVQKLFFKDGKIHAGRYILDIGKKFYILQCVDKQFRYFSLDSERELFRTLMQYQAEFSPVYFDDMTLPHETFLRSVLPLNLEDTIQIFYHMSVETVQLVVLDEKGSVQRLLLPKMDETILQSSLFECAQRMLESRQLFGGGANVTETIVQINRATRRKDGLYSARTVHDIAHSMMAEVHVIDYGGLRENAYDLSYQGAEFSEQQYGAEQFDALVHYAYHQSKLSDRIPLMVTEVVAGGSQDLMSPRFNSQGNRTQETFKTFCSAQRRLFQAIEKFKR